MRRPYRAAAIFAYIAFFAAATRAFAQDDAGPATSFQGGGRESLPGGTLLVAAYAIVWAAIFLYVAVLARRQARLRDEIERIEKVVAEAREKPKTG